MGHAARRVAELARSERHALVGRVERDLAVEDEEAFVLALVDVGRRLVAGRGDALEEAVASVGVGAARVDADERVEKPDRIHRGTPRAGSGVNSDIEFIPPNRSLCQATRSSPRSRTPCSCWSAMAARVRTTSSG